MPGPAQLQSCLRGNEFLWHYGNCRGGKQEHQAPRPKVLKCHSGRFLFLLIDRTLYWLFGLHSLESPDISSVNLQNWAQRFISRCDFLSVRSSRGELVEASIHQVMEFPSSDGGDERLRKPDTRGFSMWRFSLPCIRVGVLINRGLTEKQWRIIEGGKCFTRLLGSLYYGRIIDTSQEFLS